VATTTPAPGDVTGQVASVVLKYTGPSGSDTKTFTTITNPITQVYNALRVGVYTFNATAYDGSATPVALFSSGDVTINVYKNQLTGVNLIMQQLVPGGTAHTMSPLISTRRTG